MAVEVYLEEETTELIHDTDKSEEWIKTVEKLGLSGQLEMTQKKKSPVPFQFMNTVMERVYKTLCPSSLTVESFNKGTIPLRALSAISLAKDQRYFHKIEIWYDDVNKDPIAVGYLNGNYNSEKFIIARWGDELRSFVELKQIATKRWIEERSYDLKKRMQEDKVKLETIETLAQGHFSGEWINV